MLKQKLIIGAAAVAATSFALAGGPGDFDAPAAVQQGIYLDANFGWAVNDFDAGSGQKTKSDNGFAANVNLGYQFSQNLGAEFGFFYIPDYSVEPGDSADKVTNNFSYDLAVKGMLPFAEQFNAFAKLGVGLSTGKMGATFNPSGSQSGVAGFGALGMSWMPAAMPNLSLSVQGFAFTKANKLAGRYGVLGGVGYLFPM